MVLAIQIAQEYDLDVVEFFSTIKCESGFKSVQSQARYKEGNRWGMPAGAQEESYGPVQIHLLDNPGVSYSQAMDPEFSFRFMAEKFIEGRKSMWVCHTKLFT